MDVSNSRVTDSIRVQRPALIGLFTDHPASVGESYGEHFRFAGRFSMLLLGAGLAAATHAVLPFLFKKTASGLIAKMYAETHGRGAPPSQGTGTDWSI